MFRGFTNQQKNQKMTELQPQSQVRVVLEVQAFVDFPVALPSLFANLGKRRLWIFLQLSPQLSSLGLKSLRCRVHEA